MNDDDIIDWVLEHPVKAICGIMIFDLLLVFLTVYIMVKW